MSQRFEIDSSLAGERADTAISRLLGVSRSSAADICEQGDASVGSKTLTKSDRLSLGDKLSIKPQVEPEPLRVIETPVAELLVVYQDQDLVIVDKPAGVVSHPTLGYLNHVSHTFTVR